MRREIGAPHLGVRGGAYLPLRSFALDDPHPQARG